jgi:tetratricopeptide (TPR) repeat protein
MRKLTEEEQRQLDDGLAYRIQLIERETQDLKERQAAVEKAARDHFRPFVDYYNAARDYYYKALPRPLQRRGDFDTMEIHAQITEDFKLALIGVMGARHVTVSVKGAGYHASICDRQQELENDAALYHFLTMELLDDHPMVWEVSGKRQKAKEYFEKTCDQAGIS